MLHRLMWITYFMNTKYQLMTQESATDQFSGDEVGRRLENAPIGKEADYKVKQHLMKTLTTGGHLRSLGSCCWFYFEANFRNSPTLQPQFPSS